jgi:nucleotidyltransferase/DNA polymerase involved in DNA repair
MSEAYKALSQKVESTTCEEDITSEDRQEAKRIIRQIVKTFDRLSKYRSHPFQNYTWIEGATPNNRYVIANTFKTRGKLHRKQTNRYKNKFDLDLEALLWEAQEILKLDGWGRKYRIESVWYSAKEKAWFTYWTIELSFKISWG